MKYTYTIYFVLDGQVIELKNLNSVQIAAIQTLLIRLNIQHNIIHRSQNEHP